MNAPELGDIFRIHGPAYFAAFGDTLSGAQKESLEGHRGLPHGSARRLRQAL
jgi:hypothetical protein